ncbi:MAG TPA: DUF488 family protein [Candidatus Obscuribacterales bacterium]
MTIHTQRVYDHSQAQGHLFLVDRVWPRGITKETLSDAVWVKDVAPSTALRKWFGHDPSKWNGFLHRYFKELDSNTDAWKPILQAAKHGSVTLLYGAKDEEHNQAVALKSYLEPKLKRKRA